MTRIADFFNLGLNQGALDFVNIDVVGDVPVYIDPHALRTQNGDWAQSCTISVSSFFEALLDAIQKNDSSSIYELIRPLSEPNETHLGVSAGKSKGTSLGSDKKAQELIAQLRGSKAIATGMVIDLEDTAMFIEGIGTDILSDITTCLIREQLIGYTQQQSAFHEIPTEQQFVGPTWDVSTKTWTDELAVDVPRGPDGPLLLVPRSIVRFQPTLDNEKYFTGYIRPLYEHIELAKGLASEYVYLIREGKKNQEFRVRKTDLGKDLGHTKAKIVEHTGKFPQALDTYRNANSGPTVPLTDDRLASRVGDPPPDLAELHDAIGAIAPGKAGATHYHRAVAALLSALFVSSLGNQGIETKLHDGKKRIDISYDNVAADGFFWWVGQHYKAAIVPVECKNYSQDPKNPELDQIAMRLSPGRGQVGILVTRKINDKERFRARCRSAAHDGHGYVIALDDDDLRVLVDDVITAWDAGTNPRDFGHLRVLFKDLFEIAD